ncbi:TlpA disulfide reductase family protein [Galbibacter sp. EGI 63066]|uniref:TlpA family protein disulfide reductase n=1 Tax=Galbibacter sp. EGI 63066 TaxID=2993559 RepID=UPI0022499ED2|nr:TlpA disulfide reductase family protein [Galbibacter sp. EGI 63066]MCX2680975.1 TlpA disulfide reductase family protein [Galbibacter sp. EGI 63066]
MKTKRIKQIILAMFIQLYMLNAQTPTTEYKALKVGDKMPDYTFTNLINYPTSTAKLSDFKGKLLILDFWSTGCTACIASWPKLLELQNEFDGKVQILLVNPYQDKDIVRKVIERQKKIRNVDMTLPLVCKDTVLGKKLFPNRGVPYIVWIDENGYVKSHSYGDALNAKNIWSILKKNPVTMRQKITDYADFIKVNHMAPLFVDKNGGNGEQIIAQSQLSKSISKMWPASFVIPQTLDNKSIICITHLSIKSLYAMAYSFYFEKGSFPGYVHSSRVLLQVKDSTKYVDEDEYDEIIAENRYTYQLIASLTPIEKLQKMMQTDLDRYFGTEAHWEKRKMKCLVIKTKDTLLISYKKGIRKFFFTNPDKDGVRRVNNVTVSDFIQNLEEQHYFRSPYPIVDETGLKGSLGGIEMEKDFDPGDHRALDKALQKYKMRFTLEEKEVDVLVIREPGDNNSYQASNK